MFVSHPATLLETLLTIQKPTAPIAYTVCFLDFFSIFFWWNKHWKIANYLLLVGAEKMIKNCLYDVFVATPFSPLWMLEGVELPSLRSLEM